MTHHKDIAVIILAAGKGTRMKSFTHKVLHKVAGRTLLNHVFETTRKLQPNRTLLVVGAMKEQFSSFETDAEIILQKEQLGTGHAVKIASQHLSDFNGDILVLYGDVPFISADTLNDLISARRERAGTMISVLGFETKAPGAYGRLITHGKNSLEKIVEYKDASPKERSIKLCNSGIMAINSEYLTRGLGLLENNNKSGEYYLTDLVGHARSDGLGVSLTRCAQETVLGVNSRTDLAKAEALFQTKSRQTAMNNGVTLIDPNSVFFAADTVLGRDILIEPNVFFGPGVQISDNVTVKAFSHLEGTTLASGATIGPFARLRPGSNVGQNAKIGNFVEIKKSDIAEGVKISHLSYIGDAVIGRNANIGAGTITCNYDGYFKYRTDIEEGAFIGSNTALVAPVTIGKSAIVGAGSVITKDVAPDAVAASRAPQTNSENGATRFRDRAVLAKKNTDT